MQNYAGVNMTRRKEQDAWPFNIDQIEDRTRKNYFSLLPNEETLNESFGGAFVINQPMRNVGGDGYWLYKKGCCVFIAVFDCEGQGHLASMMTRIYANALKKLIVDNSIEFPGSILQFIHREIQSKFKNRENIQLTTGADLGIVKVDLEKRQMEYAGARMDLLKVANGQLEVVKGDPLKIGEMFDHKHEYTSVPVALDRDAKYYLWTDGVTSLQGGPSLKSFGRDNITNLLKKNAHLTMDKQRDVVRATLDKWSGGGLQHDDMLLIGFTV